MVENEEQVLAWLGMLRGATQNKEVSEATQSLLFRLYRDIYFTSNLSILPSDQLISLMQCLRNPLQSEFSDLAS